MPDPEKIMTKYFGPPIKLTEGSGYFHLAGDRSEFAPFMVENFGLKDCTVMKLYFYVPLPHQPSYSHKITEKWDEGVKILKELTEKHGDIMSFKIFGDSYEDLILYIPVAEKGLEFAKDACKELMGVGFCVNPYKGLSIQNITRKLFLVKPVEPDYSDEFFYADDFLTFFMQSWYSFFKRGYGKPPSYAEVYEELKNEITATEEGEIEALKKYVPPGPSGARVFDRFCQDLSDQLFKDRHLYYVHGGTHWANLLHPDYLPVVVYELDGEKTCPFMPGLKEQARELIEAVGGKVLGYRHPQVFGGKLPCPPTTQR